MSKILAYVDRETGEVRSTSVMSIAVDGPSDGDVIDDMVVRDITNEGEDWVKFGQHNYWDNGWSKRPTKPSPFYRWEEGQWSFDSISFEGAVRSQRDQAIALTDWTQLPDAGLSDNMLNAWRGYRQELRDVMDDLSGISSLDDVNWPEPPQ